LRSRPQPGPRFPEKGSFADMKSAKAMLVPGKINTFPEGESSDEVSVPVSILRQILEELQELREEIDRLKANQKQENLPNQDEEPIQKASVPEPKQGQNAKLIFLDSKKREGTHEIQILSGEIARLEAVHEKELERLALEMAYDRQRGSPS
jgi:hypothetical protein